MSRVLIIGDTHLPFTHKDYLKFCKNVHKKWACDKVVHIGDVFDLHAMSYHETDPDGMSAGDELKAARKMVRPWWKAFPKLTVTVGNHDKIPYRKALTHGISRHMIRDYNEVYNIEADWKWETGIEIDGVWYQHTGGSSGKLAHLTACEKHRTSFVMGHVHSYAGVAFSTSYKDKLFGMNVGCGINSKAYAFHYGKGFASRPVLGCGVVLNGLQPIFIPMELRE